MFLEQIKKMICVLIGFLFIYGCTADELRGIPCEKPKYGNITREIGGNEVEFGCEDGFFLLGPSKAHCDLETNTLTDVSVLGCIPIFQGNSSCGDRCPKDLKYLLEVYIEEPTQSQVDAANGIIEQWKSDKAMRGPKSPKRCQQICRLGQSACFAPSMRNTPRAKMVCIRCFAHRRCGTTFWG